MDNNVIKNVPAKYIGIPFKENGRDASGMDCYGLVLAIYKELGIELPETDFITDSVIRQNFFADNIKLFKQVENPSSFAIVTFKLNPPYVTHAGVVLPDLRHFIHCSRKTGVVIESLKRWENRIEGYYKPDA